MSPECTPAARKEPERIRVGVATNQPSTVIGIEMYDPSDYLTDPNHWINTIMGVSILMTPGPIGRNRGKQVNITPGLRSAAAGILRQCFGEAPFTLTGRDVDILRTMETGASIYAGTNDNLWKTIADAIEEHDAVTIVTEY